MNPDEISQRSKYERGWHGGLPETPCGAGSKLSYTKKQRIVIPQWMDKYGIKTIADIGAGDLNWVKHIEWLNEPVITHYDLVPRHVDVKPLDLLHDDLPEADCIWLLWVLNHFPEQQMLDGLMKVLSSDSKYFLHTWDTRLPWDVPFVEQIEIRGPSVKRPAQYLRLSRIGPC